MTVIDLFTVQIVMEDGTYHYTAGIPAKVAALMAEAEENLTDLLPAGYRARIRRWDHPVEPTQEDNDE